MYFVRNIEAEITESLVNNPIVGILGPRQCGKSTLVKNFMQNRNEYVYLDLERPSDLVKLENAEWFFESQKGKLICIDEIQRRPELFPLLRSIADDWGTNGNFILLGSASIDLLKQSSESLAGRISYKGLTPFLCTELQEEFQMEKYLERGGFPRSYLAGSDKASMEWRQNFLTTFIERDLPQLSGISTSVMRRMWTMLAYNNGQITNYASISNSIGVSAPTIRNYIDLLEGTFMLFVLPPYFSNMGKRMVKAPKVYIADTGIINAMLGLQNFNQLSAHPVFGSLWETMVLANLKGHFPNATFSFYRTSNGAECDIVMELSGNVFSIECKANKEPVLAKGFYLALEDIRPKKAFVVIPTEKGWSHNPLIDMVSIKELISSIQAIKG